MEMSDFQQYLSNLYDVEDIVVFLGLKLFNSDNVFSCSCHFSRETKLENNQFSKL